MAYEGCCDGGEGEEVLGLVLVAPVETPAAGQPGHRSLHDPAVPSQPLGGLDAFARDAVADAAGRQPSPQALLVLVRTAMSSKLITACR